MRHVPVQSRVTLKNAVFPDGGPVEGIWTVIGRHGKELIAESRGTIIRFPERIAQVEWTATKGTVPARSRKKVRAAS